MNNQRDAILGYADEKHAYFIRLIENNTVFVDQSLVDLDELMTELQGVFKSLQIEWRESGGLAVFTDYILSKCLLNSVAFSVPIFLTLTLIVVGYLF